VIVHLNGKLVPLAEAHISPLDRGFLFGDGLYEGLRSFDGRIVGMPRHAERLRRGLSECRLPWDAALVEPLSHELLRANNLRDAFIYWQITRGVPAPGQPVRSRLLKGPVSPTLFGYCVPTQGLDAYAKPPTKSCVTVSDVRWHLGHIKSTSLISSVLAAQDAEHAGHDDAIMIRHAPSGALLAESTSANAAVALRRADGTLELATPSTSSVSILAGVTRDLLLAELPDLIERPVTASELVEAQEVMLLGTLTMVTAVVKLDGRRVGTGEPGPAAQRLLETLCRLIRQGC
jgi:D-alanine transaminase